MGVEIPMNSYFRGEMREFCKMAKIIVFKQVSHPSRLPRFSISILSYFQKHKNYMPCLLTSKCFDNNRTSGMQSKPYINGNIPCGTTYRNTVHCSLHTHTYIDSRLVLAHKFQSVTSSPCNFCPVVMQIQLDAPYCQRKWWAKRERWSGEHEVQQVMLSF